MTNTRWFQVPGFCMHDPKVIRIDVYDTVKELRKSIGNNEAYGMWKLYAKRQDRKAIGRIAVSRSACAVIVVHESTHAARDILSWLDWNNCDDEEEELIADTVAEVATAVARVLGHQKNPLVCS